MMREIKYKEYGFIIKQLIKKLLNFKNKQLIINN